MYIYINKYVHVYIYICPSIHPSMHPSVPYIMHPPFCAGTTTADASTAPTTAEPKAKSKAKAKAKAKSGANGRVGEVVAKTMDEMKSEMCALAFKILLLLPICLVVDLDFTPVTTCLDCEAIP